ncbi:alpha/beta fold hydrolase [Cohnella algarum]|uniref:alpha/beta hydrolase family protein n=1 Tax=Cohnella algarum TaxID=2044859 RepID=UPI00196818B3|nr:alpha/beta fold hydrolase [Cohnella algarum]MBN2983112.1 alpha/beta fold hydrolase [Cohnella algarum]
MNKSSTVRYAIAVAALALALNLPAAVSAAEGSGIPTASAQAAAADAAGGSGLVPLRVAAETLGASVKWQGAGKIAVARGPIEIQLQVGQTSAVVNGETRDAGSAVRTIDGKTYVSLDFLAQALDSRIGWDEAAGKLVIAEDDFVARANEFVYRLARGDAASAAGSFSSALQSALPAPALSAIWPNLAQAYGLTDKQLSSSHESNAVHTSVGLAYESAVGPFDVTVRFDADGRLDDFNFAPASAAEPYKAPAYDDPAGYEERDVVVGEGAFALPGTLTMPKGEGPFPAVVLVHGSGPHDRDSTIGGAKPFRDLAVGLAGEGIAVLRYEKVTLEHTVKSSAAADFTIEDETVNDALKAVGLLAQTDGIDPRRIYVVGHSQGGFAVPKLIESDAEGSVAGAVLLSSPSGTFGDVLVEQQQEALDRLKRLGFPQETLAAQEQALAAYANIVSVLNDPQFSTDNLPSPEQFALQPAYWWYDIRDYVPSETAKTQTRPLLILQGENDWQVSMKQFEGWKEALKGRTDVEYKSYPNMNHLLTEYEGISVGAEYNRAANVPAEFIADIAAWVKKR